MKNVVCLTGHRLISNDKIRIVSKRLEAVLKVLINNGYSYFGVGGALGFDKIAALTIISLKSIYNNIKLILVLPCKEHFKYWNDKEKSDFYEIKFYADKIVYISDEYYKGCTLERNRHLVDCSKICVCYLNKDYGGTAYTVNYAKKKGLFIINIDDIL